MRTVLLDRLTHLHDQAHTHPLRSIAKESSSARQTVIVTHKIRPRPRRQITHNLSRVSDQLKDSLFLFFGGIEFPLRLDPKLSCESEHWEGQGWG